MISMAFLIFLKFLSRKEIYIRDDRKRLDYNGFEKILECSNESRNILINPPNKNIKKKV